MMLLTSVLLFAATALAQSSDRLPVTDAQKIADALRAGPEFITKMNRVGISYMYVGAWVKSAKNPSGLEHHVGPHLMIVSPHHEDFQGVNRDGSNGMPYVAHLPGHAELYLVMPIREWDEP